MFKGDPKDLSKFLDYSPVLGCVDDPEVIASLVKAGVDGPTIFSLVWGHEMCVQNERYFPEALREVVSSIEEHTKKKEEAFDAQEQKLYGIIIDLLQVMYEKEVNNIIEIILKK